MVGPGGPCERCGGPTFWTTVRGEVWVACQDECLDDQLLLDGSRNPPLTALCSEGEGRAELRGTEEGKGPPEGAVARMSDSRIHEPPPGWLSSLWEGGSYGSR